MICRRPYIRPEERDRHDELRAERYETLYAEIEAAERAQYDEDFGPTYRAKYPFKPNGQRIHDKVMQALRSA